MFKEFVYNPRLSEVGNDAVRGLIAASVNTTHFPRLTSDLHLLDVLAHSAEGAFKDGYSTESNHLCHAANMISRFLRPSPLPNKAKFNRGWNIYKLESSSSVYVRSAGSQAKCEDLLISLSKNCTRVYALIHHGKMVSAACEGVMLLEHPYQLDKKG